MSRIRVAVLASGRGSNLQAIMDAIGAGKLDAEIAVVVSDKEKAQALERARARGIDALYISNKDYSSREDYDQAILQALEKYRVDLICLAGYMRILTPILVRAYRNRIMNIHPSLLPAFPGLHAQRQALEHGVKVSGATVHFVDEEIDHGAIIIQAAVPVLEGDNEETLAARILEEEHRIYPQAIQWFSEGRLKVEGRRVSILSAPRQAPEVR